MGICSDAEYEDTSDSYKKMYEQLSALSCGEIGDLLEDARGAIETKLVLGEDSANLTDGELLSLLDQAKKSRSP